MLESEGANLCFISGETLPIMFPWRRTADGAKSLLKGGNRELCPKDGPGGPASTADRGAAMARPSLRGRRVDRYGVTGRLQPGAV